MANHTVATFPWDVPSEVLYLFTQHMMKTVFGGYYIPVLESDDSDGCDLAFKSLADDSFFTEIWSKSSTQIESRHQSFFGLNLLAQNVEFETLSAAFGSVVNDDEGIGRYRVSRPGTLHFVCFRRFNFGYPSSSEALWGINPKMLPQAEAMLDSSFFKISKTYPSLKTYPSFSRPINQEHYQRLFLEDVFEWKHHFDWTAIINKEYPSAKGLDETKAGAILLPSASLGIACPQQALDLATLPSLERALGVALLWSNAQTAKQIHSKIIQMSQDPEASEQRAQKICAEFLLQRAQAEEGDVISYEKESSDSLLESLALSRGIPQSLHKVHVKTLSTL